MQSFERIRTHERRSEVMAATIATMNGEDQTALDHAGLVHCIQFPVVRVHQAMLTALIERWSSETSTFHLLIGEMTVTLEDVTGDH